MPKKRDREEEETPKKFRQTTLEFHFSSKDNTNKRKKVEDCEVAEASKGKMNKEVMSEEERLQRRRVLRDLRAGAAERRKQANSPVSTPPQSPPSTNPEQDLGSSPDPAAASSSKIDISDSPSSSSAAASKAQSTKTTSTQKKSEMLTALSRTSEEPEQSRTSSSDDPNAVYRRVDWYDYVVQQTEKVASGGAEACSEGQSHGDELGGTREQHEGQSHQTVGPRGKGKLREGPSASREPLEERLADAEGKLDELEERERRQEKEGKAGTSRGPPQGTRAASPPLEYSYDGDGSQPLFTDSEPLEYSQANEDQTAAYWKGTPISEMNRAPDCLDILPELRPARDHTVLFRPQVRSDIPPRPFPESYQDRWDSDHVRMPCSPENLYPVEDQSGCKKVQSRWELIETTLLGGIKNSLDLEEAILTYNARYSQRWNFRALHMLFTEVLDSEETMYFFDNVLPEMVRLALQLPKLCTQAIPLLKKQHTHSITLSQHQISSLLANAFFCTFPRRNAQQKKSEYSSFPDINLNRLFEFGHRAKNHRKIEKLKCILNYFRRVTSNAPTGAVTITRRSLHNMPRWDTSSSPLSRLHMASSGIIEREGHGMLQVDFANQYMGGGALGYGLVQEEIRFMICPELIVTRLLTEVMEDNECVIIKGVEQFSNYSGYANSFKWTGTCIDHTPRDRWGRKETEIVAIDALVIRSRDSQFNPSLLHREINKAYCGYYSNQVSPKHLQAVATGNWGCGAFGGDTRLKGLLQLMAASENSRDMVYFTFGDKELCDDMAAMHDFLSSQGVTVGELWVKLRRYWTDVVQRKAGAAKPRLFPYLYQLYTTCDSDTDEYDPEEQTGTRSESTAQGDSLSPNYAAGTP